MEFIIVSITLVAIALIASLILTKIPKWIKILGITAIFSASILSSLYVLLNDGKPNIGSPPNGAEIVAYESVKNQWIALWVKHPIPDSIFGVEIHFSDYNVPVAYMVFYDKEVDREMQRAKRSRRRGAKTFWIENPEDKKFFREVFPKKESE